MSDEHLTHGWEPDLPDSDSLLLAYVRTNADASVAIAEGVGGRSMRWPDATAADPGSAVFFDNAAVLLVPPAYTDLDDLIARITAFYPPERHFVLLSAWPTPDLTGHGLQLMGHPPFMVRPAGGSAPPIPDGLDIVRVTDAGQLAEFAETLLAGFGMPTDTGVPMTDPGILDGPIRLFLGYREGKAVATSGVRLGHGIIDVEWVSCLPEARGGGVGAAITWAASLAEPDLPSTLIASDDGQPVYERMGYLRMHRLTMWHRPPLI